MSDDFFERAKRNFRFNFIAVLVFNLVVAGSMTWLTIWAVLRATGGAQ